MHVTHPTESITNFSKLLARKICFNFWTFGNDHVNYAAQHTHQERLCGYRILSVIIHSK